MNATDRVFPTYNSQGQVVDWGITIREEAALRILAAYCNEANIGQWDADARLRAARAAFRLADSFIEASQEEM